MKDCTFEPELHQSRYPTTNNTPRDLDTFLTDQQRFLEKKQDKQLKAMHENSNKEVEELHLQPKLDDLSMQIVDMMDDRKGQKTYDRLYKKGYESLRYKSQIEQETKLAEEEHSFRRPSPSRYESNDPN